MAADELNLAELAKRGAIAAALMADLVVNLKAPVLSAGVDLINLWA